MRPTVRCSNRRSSGSTVSSRPAEPTGHPQAGPGFYYPAARALLPGGDKALRLLTKPAYLERHGVARA